MIWRHDHTWRSREPVSLEELLCHLPKVERLFKLDDGSFEEDPIPASPSARLAKGPDLVARYEKLPAFRRRNLGTLLGGRM
jgi:hypothetical protein